MINSIFTESAAGSWSVYDDTYSDADRAGRSVLRNDVGSGLDIWSIFGNLRAKAGNVLSGTWTGTNYAQVGNITISGSLALDSNDLGAHQNADGDDTAEIQSALDAAGENAKIVLHPKVGNYVISAALRFKNGQIIEGWGGNGQFNTSNTNQVTIRMTGSATNAIFEPYTPASDTVNVQIRNLKLQGNGNTLVGVSFYRTSYSVIENCLITDCDIGLELDANTSNQAYFNDIRNCKIAYNDVVNIRLQRGANANRFYNVWLGGTVRSVEVLSPSSNNEFHACNFQGVASPDGTDIHLYSDYGSTYVYGGWVEACGTAFHETSNGSVHIFGATIGGNVTNIVVENSVSSEGIKFFRRPNDTGSDLWTVAQIGSLWMTNISSTPTDNFLFNLKPRNSTNVVQYVWGWGSTNTLTANRSLFVEGTNTHAYIDHQTGSFIGNNEDSELGLWTVGVKQGTGDPNGSITGRVGHVFLRRDGGAGTSFYVKESGDNTDTGWVGK